MKIYTSGCGGKKLDEITRLDMGILATPPDYPRKGWIEHDVALDNGAFPCWLKGESFSESNFLKHIEKSRTSGCSIDFIVCPDIVAGGLKSLDFSINWADSGNFVDDDNIYLAVQDGMTTDDITDDILSRFGGVFIGGTPAWKWMVAEEWVNFSHSNDKMCHIGGVGRLAALHRANQIGVDSVDSSNFSRNDSFHVVDIFRRESIFDF